MSIKMRKILSAVLILFSLFLLMLILDYNRLLAVVIPSWNSMFPEKKEYPIANSWGESIVITQVGDNEIEITPFLASDGNYYLILPAMADSFRVANLSDEVTAFADGKQLSGKEILFSDISESSGISLDNGEKLYVKRSQNISAMFLNVDVEQDVLDSQKGEEHGATCLLIDENGNTKFSNKLESISVRGNSTFYASKKPYELKFESEAELLQTCSCKKWILVANAYDSSLMKNEIVYDFARTHTNIVGPVGDYVDLYINGDYRGNYYLCNRPQNEDYLVAQLGIDVFKRLYDMAESEDEIGTFEVNADQTVFGRPDTDTAAQGEACLYLVEITKQKGPENAPGFYTKSGEWGRVAVPKGATVSQVEYIKKQFDELEDAINANDGINPVTNKKIEEYMDIESYADRYLIDNVFQNHDSNLASSWFYKKPDAVDTRIFTGPIWDYDFTMHYVERLSVSETAVTGNVYLGKSLLKYASFVELLNRRYAEAYAPYVKYEMPMVVYNLNGRISQSRNLNDIRWGISNRTDESLIDELTDTTKQRLETIAERILRDDLYCNVTFLNYDKTVERIEVVRRGESLEDVFESRCLGAIFNGWVSQTDGALLTENTKIWEDTTYESQWIDVDILVLNGLSIAQDVNVESIDVETLEQVVDEIRRMQGGK